MAALPGRRALLAVRQLVLAASILRGHLARDPWAAAWVAWRALPTTLRRPLLDVTRRVTGESPLTALGLASAGHRLEARQLLASQVDRAESGRLLAVASAATALGEHQIAWRALDLAAAADSHLRRVESRLLWHEGHLRRAIEVAASGADRQSRRLRRRMKDDLAALTPQLRIPARSRVSRIDHSAEHQAPRVLHVVTNSLPQVQAGYTVRTHGIAQAQAARGNSVHVVTRLGFPADIGALGSPDRLTLDDVTYHRLQPLRGLRASAADRLDQNIEALERLTRTVRPAALHAHSRHDNAQVSLAVARRCGLPMIYEVRGFLEETWRTAGGDPSSDRYRLAQDAETWCMQQSDLVVTLSETMRREILRRGISPDHVFVVPNAVPDWFLQERPDRALARGKLGIGPTAFVLGIVTTLSDYEGVDTLLSALRLVDDPAVQLLVVGDGPARQGLTQAAADLAGRVTFTGKVPHDQIRGYYSTIDVFCVPRRRTAVTELVPPLKPLEALAMGIPILVSDLPPLTELLAQSGGGWAAPPDTPEAWARRIESIRRDDAERKTIGAHAAAWVQQHRTWPALAERYQEIYGRLGI